ncbi:MAG: response regulator [Deltaproteobacteria bacterium]|nr:response regulator [Deltaproteobacteria bacterium]
MSMKILLADDSITIQKVIGIIFGGGEYALTVVDNGKAALDKAREVAPDVLLIDALMPGMSGYEVCEAIRAIPALAQKPILLLTGSFEPFDEVRARSCGADDILAKPFESQHIIAKVKELYALGLSRAAAASQPAPLAEPSSFAPPIMPTEAPTVGEPLPGATEDDIWSAFTPLANPAPTAATAAIQPMPEAALEPDVFAIAGEEPDAPAVEPAAAPTAPSDSTGTRWIPVEEHTFEFEEEAAAELPANAFSGLESPQQEVSFGEISFEEEPAMQAAAPPVAAAEPPLAESPLAAAFAEPAFPFSETLTPDLIEPAAPAFEATPGIAEAPPAAIAPAVLSEAQLKAAIAAVSQEVIERIVWEVVPDLAESLIKEAIRKIKEGL